MKRVYLIINAKAGKTKGRAIMFDIVQLLCEHDYEVVTQVTLYAGHAAELAEADAREGGDFIVCCGGDGTLNEVVMGVIKSGCDIEVGYVPCGSTNDFANSLKLSSDVTQACIDIIDGAGHKIDIGQFNGRNFTYIASFGAFTAVSYNTSQEIKNIFGHFAYVLEGIKDIKSLVPYHVRAEANGTVYEDDYIFGSVCNSTSIGGIVKLKEYLVSMNDGEFEVILIRLPRTPIELNEIIKGITTSDFTGKMFDFFRASEIDIHCGGDFDWSLDGERAEGEEHISIKNLHNAITLRK